jgi:tetrahydrodipicolinate N-succinyltransferase
VISMAQNLWTIHQTVSTKVIAKLLDIDLSVLRSEQMSSKEISKVFKSSEKKRCAKDAKVEEFKTMRLNTTSSERKQSGSF